MTEHDEAIKKAAEALANALSASGKDYIINFHQLEVTRLSDAGRRYIYEPHIREVNERKIV